MHNDQTLIKCQDLSPLTAEVLSTLIISRFHESPPTSWKVIVVLSWMRMEKAASIKLRNPRNLAPIFSQEILMERAPLKVSLPSDIAAAFCATLLENNISYSSTTTSTFRQDDSGLVVNSANDLKEIAIALIDSKPFWSTVAAGIWAFSRRHKHKSLYVEKDGFKFKASGMSKEDLTEAIKDAQRLSITETDE
jgi:hypothetical protein